MILNKSSVLELMQLNIDKLMSDFCQVRIYADLKIKILSKSQIIQVLIDFRISVNYMSQMFFIKNKWKNIESSKKIWYVNDEMTHYYEIININYLIPNFKESLENEILFFHLINLIEHDFILDISWLRKHQKACR